MIRGQVFQCGSAFKENCPHVLRSTAAVTAVTATAATGPQIIHGFWNKWQHTNWEMKNEFTAQKASSNHPALAKALKEGAFEINAEHRDCRLKLQISQFTAELLSMSHSDKTNIRCKNCTIRKVRFFSRHQLFWVSQGSHYGILEKANCVMQWLKRHWWKWEM